MRHVVFHRAHSPNFFTRTYCRSTEPLAYFISTHASRARYDGNQRQLPLSWHDQQCSNGGYQPYQRGRYRYDSRSFSPSRINTYASMVCRFTLAGLGCRRCPYASAAKHFASGTRQFQKFGQDDRLLPLPLQAIPIIGKIFPHIKLKTRKGTKECERN